MRRVYLLFLLALGFSLNGCIDDPKINQDDLVGRWESVNPDPNDPDFAIVLYYEMKDDFTLEEGFLKRNLKNNEEFYRFMATSEYFTKNGFLEFRNYKTFRAIENQGTDEYVPKNQLVKYGTPISRKMPYKLLENNTVLSVYQGCPADFCYDVLYDKK